MVKMRSFFALLLLLSTMNLPAQETEFLFPSMRVHAFYYPWYANPEIDGAWSHWNHHVILQGGRAGESFLPPEEIGANFYPALGLYSTRDPAAIRKHAEQLISAGVGVVSLSWWGQDSPTDRSVSLILNVCVEHGLYANFHIEPYPGRNASTVKTDIEYILKNYGESPAFYRIEAYQNRPLFYVYDSYLTPAEEWATVLSSEGADTIRGTDADALVIGLYVKEEDHRFMKIGHFDGFYTYFATEGFTYGSTPSHWPKLAEWARENGKIFIPCVGPGYDDTRIRPWNTRNQRDRMDGKYYDEMWRAALEVNPEIVSITSFNEWHEGTQIAPAVPKSIPGYTYEDYQPHEPEYYLNRTRMWVEKFLRSQAAMKLQ